MPTDVDFQAIFEATPGAYLVVDPKLCIVAASNSYLASTMTARDEIVGKHIFEAFPENPADANSTGVRNVGASLDRVIRDRVPDAMAVQRFDIRRPDGTFEERHWSAVSCPVLGEGGSLLYVVHSIVDVTDLATGTTTSAPSRTGVDLIRRGQDLQRANEELRTNQRELVQFRLLVDSVQDYAIFMLDPAGRVASWNLGAERILGYKSDEIIGKSVDRFHQESDREAGKPAREIQIARDAGRFEEETWRVRKDGSMFWANVVLTPIHDRGTFLGFAKVTRDLTARRDAEEERVRLAQAHEALRLRDEFLSIASHELRTPLTALDLQVQGLESQREIVDPKLKTKIHRMAKSTARLRALIETLLDVSRIATGRFTVNALPGDMVAFVDDVAEQLEERARAAGCTIDVERRVTSAPVLIDPLRMDQVLTNVLENAFKFGAEKPVHLAVDAKEGCAVVAVSDHGPGIAQKDRERIFNRFERAAPTQHYGGLGLGLYVSREIVAAHGGSITARSNASEGACLEIRIPLDNGRTHPRK